MNKSGLTSAKMMQSANPGVAALVKKKKKSTPDEMRAAALRRAYMDLMYIQEMTGQLGPMGGDPTAAPAPMAPQGPEPMMGMAQPPPGMMG